MNIKLKAKHHALIIALLPDKARVDILNYMYQVAKQVKAQIEQLGELDPEHEIAVDVPESLITYCFGVIGSFPENLVAADNREIKEALMPQIMDHPELLQQITGIVSQNGSQTELRRNQGYEFLKAITA